MIQLTVPSFFLMKVIKPKTCVFWPILEKSGKNEGFSNLVLTFSKFRQREKTLKQQLESFGVLFVTYIFLLDEVDLFTFYFKCGFISFAF